MPNYFALARSGVVFADHHAVYPTFTMLNSASIATGTYPGVHGFYGNVVYAPNARGKNAKGVDIDFSAPAFIEDLGIVEAVRESYQGKLTLVSTMLQAAQARGLTTAAIGKFGAAFIQDYKRGGIILDEDAAMPVSLAKELQMAGYALPRNTVNAYDAGALVLANDNGDPTAPIAIQRLKDGQTANPLDRIGALCRGHDIPTLSGILFDGTRLHPTKNDADGRAGSDYLFVPDRDLNTVKAAVVSLQSRLQFGAIFVSDKYGHVAGTLPMSLINTENPVAGRGPDIIVSFTFDETVAVAGRPGISYASSINRRGDHGSFSRTDTHISMMAHGPDFKSGLSDTLPTANVDVSPTVCAHSHARHAGRSGASAGGGIEGRTARHGIHGVGQDLRPRGRPG